MQPSEARDDWTGAFDYQHLQCRTQYPAEAEYGSWPPPSVDRLIADPAILRTVRHLFDEPVKFFKGVFVHSKERPERQGLRRRSALSLARIRRTCGPPPLGSTLCKARYSREASHEGLSASLAAALFYVWKVPDN